jgi:hypothetical protein
VHVLAAYVWGLSNPTVDKIVEAPKAAQVAAK